VVGAGTSQEHTTSQQYTEKSFANSQRITKGQSKGLFLFDRVLGYCKSPKKRNAGAFGYQFQPQSPPRKPQKENVAKSPSKPSPIDSNLS